MAAKYSVSFPYPMQYTAADEYKGKVHCDPDESDEYDSYIDGIDLKEGRRVANDEAESLLCSDELGSDDYGPAD